MELKGNFTESAVFKRAGLSPEALAQFEGKAFLVVFYLGEAEAQADLFHGRVLDRLRGVAPAPLLRALARFNLGAASGLESVPDDGILERAAGDRFMRVLVVIAGEGPKASGIPRCSIPSST